MNLMDILTQQLNGGALSQISKNIGIDEKTASMAISSVAPLLISAFAKKSSQPEHAEVLHQKIADGHDDVLDHVMGDRKDSIQSGLAKQTGLDASAISGLMAAVAPMVIGAISQQQKKQGFDAGGLSSFLNNQNGMIQAAAPAVMSALFNMLDANKDGNVMDDIGRIAGKLFGSGK